MNCRDHDRYCEQLFWPGGCPVCRCEERRLREQLASANEKLRAFEHYVMTGRNEQHDRLVADLEAARKALLSARGVVVGAVQSPALVRDIINRIDAALAGEKK